MDKLKLNAENVAEFAAKFVSDEFRSFVDATKAAPDEEAGTFEVVITSEDVDRYGEIVAADGIDITAYMQNPVVLWGHSHFTLPIGICTDIRREGTKTIAKGRFAPEAANPFAQQIRRLYDAGIVRATSIGFIVKKMVDNVITECELIEFSFVSVPANPAALSTLVKSGVQLDEVAIRTVFQFATKDAPTPEEEAAKAEAEAAAAAQAEADAAAAAEAQAATDAEAAAAAAGEQPAPEGEKAVARSKAIAEAFGGVKAAIVALEAAIGEPERDEAASPERSAAEKWIAGHTLSQRAVTLMAEALREFKLTR